MTATQFTSLRVSALMTGNDAQAFHSPPPLPPLHLFWGGGGGGGGITDRIDYCNCKVAGWKGNLYVQITVPWLTVFIL